MAEDFGSGVTRTLSALARQFTGVVWQSGKPPLDSELNLMGQLDFESLRQAVSSQVHSGFFLDPARAAGDFQFHSSWSNHFKFGRHVEDEPHIFAAVNGMIIPIAGTHSQDLDNIIRLSPPPETDARTDLVFLEVWRTLVAPNPSVENKPSASEIYKYGNTQYGGMNVEDDLEDPSLGFETTERVQVQYRLRVFGSSGALGESAALHLYPDGLEDTNIKGQGTAESPVEGMYFTSMRDELGDPSLWRAGDGDASNGLGTVDGYVYAIPVCAIFRRNARPYQAISDSDGGAPQHNGAPDRNPSARFLTNPRDGAMVLSHVTLSSAIDSSDLNQLLVNGLSGSGLDDPKMFDLSASRFLVVGEGSDMEIFEFTAADASNTTGVLTIASRGRGGSTAKYHEAGTPVHLYNLRPDHLFSDEVAKSDVLDLRRGVSFGDWDFERLLYHNVASLVRGDLHTTWKKNGGGGDSKGPVIHAVDYLSANGNDSDIPLHVDGLDGPDGIRTVWSDAAVVQTGVTVLCDHEAPLNQAQPTGTFTHTVNWQHGADFQPTGFVNNTTGTAGWKNGSVIFLHIGGEDGESGARSTFRENARAVRFVSPQEWWKAGYPDADPRNGQQHPIQIRFMDQVLTQTPPDGKVASDGNTPGPLYPWRELKFEKPFMALGGIVHEVGKVEGISTSASLHVGEVDLGIDFDEVGAWFSEDYEDSLDPSKVAYPCLHGTRTIWDLIYNGGKDNTGHSSELYLLLYGDETQESNNGVFQVIAAGAEYRVPGGVVAGSSTRVRIRALEGSELPVFVGNTKTVTAELRTQHMFAEDGEGSSSGRAAVAICITDIASLTSADMPWNANNSGGTALSELVESKMIISTTLMYNPSRGGTSRIADKIHRLSVLSGGDGYLKNQVSDIDTAFNGDTGFPEGERHYAPTSAQLWNRLPSLGLDAPYAPHYGGRVVAQSEQDRECELFVDRGSKTVVFRPFQRRQMAIQTFSFQDVGGSGYSAELLKTPTYTNGLARDNAGIFDASLTLGMAVPPELMPRFGRQDIPFHVRTGDTDPILSGINHLFADEIDETSETFCIIGGENNGGVPGSNEVTPMLFQTGETSGLDYCERADIENPANPAYQARIVSLPEVISSDLGHGMTGIELPPNHGIARLYGVYERQDYINKVSGDHAGAFKDDRVTLDEDPPTNLLKTDAVKQTLFIRQGGGQDMTGSADDHTYVIPSEVVDFRNNPNYDAVSSPDFEDYEYVIECVVFGFATGFINKNNYVLARRKSGTGLAVSAMGDGSPELEDVRLIVPVAATANDEAYISYARTPYQGDPFMTREGETQQVTDFQHRLGQIPLADAHQLRSEIQQFDKNGNLQIERPNPRAFEVLASVDFYTTLGTGKIGGKLYPGTVYDVGCIAPTSYQSSRIPLAEAVNAGRGWAVEPRAFTEGQVENESRAKGEIAVIQNAAIAATFQIAITDPEGSYIQLVTAAAPDPTLGEWEWGATVADTASSIAEAINKNPALYRCVKAIHNGGNNIRLISQQTGHVGNTVTVEISNSGTVNTTEYLSLYADRDAEIRPLNLTKMALRGGRDIAVNAGAGSSQLDLTGMVERLPLGILLQDSDFLCENPLGDNASAFVTSPAGIRPVQNVLPLTERGSEYTRFFGAPGEIFAMSDGAIRRYTAYEGPDTGTDSGTRRFRLYRGGGSCFMLSGSEPGGPLDWVSDSIPASMEPVLKGGALACKALLVRNFYEEAYSTEDRMKRSDGDEIQMVILTYGILGDGSSQRQGVEISGVISPTGFGEGYAASDRYLIEGRPMLKGRRRDAPDPTVDPAPFSQGGDES